MWKAPSGDHSLVTSPGTQASRIQPGPAATPHLRHHSLAQEASFLNSTLDPGPLRPPQPLRLHQHALSPQVRPRSRGWWGRWAAHSCPSGRTHPPWPAYHLVLGLTSAQ